MSPRFSRLFPRFSLFNAFWKPADRRFTELQQVRCSCVRTLFFSSSRIWILDVFNRYPSHFYNGRRPIKKTKRFEITFTNTNCQRFFARTPSKNRNFRFYFRFLFLNSFLNLLLLGVLVIHFSGSTFVQKQSVLLPQSLQASNLHSVPSWKHRVQSPN